VTVGLIPYSILLAVLLAAEEEEMNDDDDDDDDCVVEMVSLDDPDVRAFKIC